MKKIYQQPTTLVVAIKPASIIAASECISIGDSYSGDEIAVKEQSQSSYNVWDDDWSQ